MVAPEGNMFSNFSNNFCKKKLFMGEANYAT